MQKSSSLGCGCIFDRKYHRFHEKDRVLEKKCQVLEKNPNRFPTFRKISKSWHSFCQNAAFFHEIRQNSGRNLGKSRFLERKCQVADGFLIGFVKSGKNFQNLTYFFAKTRSFREIDQIFGPKAHSRATRTPTQSKGFCSYNLTFGA